MEKIQVNLENCYGIPRLNHEFDFSKKKAAIVYAPNGMMKTSFAKTFKDHSSGSQSLDRIFKSKASSREIYDHNGDNVSAESVFVIEPYNSGYESDKVSSLLVNKELKDEYDAILKNIDEKLASLLANVRREIGVKQQLEDIISIAFTRKPGNVLRALDRVKGEVLNDPLDSSLDGVEYTQIFNDKVEKILSDADLKDALQDYTANYESLLDSSRFFRRGVFNHYQASEITKQLKNHGFFNANHTVNLSDGDSEVKVSDGPELDAVIAQEMDKILSDAKLRKSFEKIDKKISNKELRDFRELILAHQDLIPRLSDPESLREDILKFHLMKQKSEFSELISAFEGGRARLDEIAATASAQKTRWQEVIDIFNRRFSVPFEVVMRNKEDVILKRVTPNVAFEFKSVEGDAPEPVEKSNLFDILSNGERRALYLLNVIFEIEARISEGVQTLFVIDDIAESFDYKNKYAIVEYLSDILQQDNFRQIILTHNYDFYRTIWHRLSLGGANFVASKDNGTVSLNPETMYGDPFQKWKRSASNEEKRDCLFAMLPFVRNLAEYCGYDECASELTKGLHVKIGQEPLTVGRMLEIFSDVLHDQEFTLESPEDNVVDRIIEIGQQIADAQDENLDLEKKVVLSIAIRLRCEQHMIQEINENDWVGGITKNQTAKLAGKFKSKFLSSPDRLSSIASIDRVNLMTPENIHLNSFMFEPILDMSARHLVSLFSEVNNL